MVRKMLLLVLISALILSGCGEKALVADEITGDVVKSDVVDVVEDVVIPEEEPVVPAVPESGVEFMTGSCDAATDHGNVSNLGIKDVSWVGDSLQVKAKLLMRCDEEIVRSDIEIEGTDLYIAYMIDHCESCGACMCAKDVTFVLDGVEKSTYDIILVGL